MDTPFDPDLVTRLRADLAPWSVDALADLLGPVASAALHREDLVPALRAVEAKGEDPRAILLRTFVLGEVVAEDALAGALPTLGVDGAVGLGLLEQVSGGVRALLDLRPYGDEEHDWWLASDLSEHAVGGPLPVDHVLGIGGASTTLASWTVRPQVGRALDLGTGCGIQALHLGAHAGEVVGTDISGRALRIAALNAALNGQEWDLRQGSFFGPVEGETYALVVSHPPFVITPRTPEVPVYEYRDGGQCGDSVVADVVAAAARHLAPGGIAQLLGNWEVPAGGDWRTVVGGWLERARVDVPELDAWVIQRDVQDPAEYARMWSRDGGQQPGTPEHRALVTAWLDDFESRRVGEIGFGVLTLHRGHGGRPGFTDLVAESGPVSSPMGPAILAGLRARDWLAGQDDAAVLDVAWRCAPDVTEERHGRPGEEPSVIVVRQGSGLRRAIRVDTLGAALLSVCDGELTAGQALTAIAALLDLDGDEAAGEGAQLVRTLVADGLLVRA